MIFNDADMQTTKTQKHSQKKHCATNKFADIFRKCFAMEHCKRHLMDLHNLNGISQMLPEFFGKHPKFNGIHFVAIHSNGKLFANSLLVNDSVYLKFRKTFTFNS